MYNNKLSLDCMLPTGHALRLHQRVLAIVVKNHLLIVIRCYHQVGTCTSVKF